MGKWCSMAMLVYQCIFLGCHHFSRGRKWFRELSVSGNVRAMKPQKWFHLRNVNFNLSVALKTQSVHICPTCFHVLRQKTIPNNKWRFPWMGVPQYGWFVRENPSKIDDLGVPPFQEIPKWWLLRRWAIVCTHRIDPRLGNLEAGAEGLWFLPPHLAHVLHPSSRIAGMWIWGVPQMGWLQIIHLYRISHYRPSIIDGYPHFRKPPYDSLTIWRSLRHVGAIGWPLVWSARLFDKQLCVSAHVPDAALWSFSSACVLTWRDAMNISHRFFWRQALMFCYEHVFPTCVRPLCYSLSMSLVAAHMNVISLIKAKWTGKQLTETLKALFWARKCLNPESETMPPI